MCSLKIIEYSFHGIDYKKSFSLYYFPVHSLFGYMHNILIYRYNTVNKTNKILKSLYLKVRDEVSMRRRRCFWSNVKDAIKILKVGISLHVCDVYYVRNII